MNSLLKIISLKDLHLTSIQNINNQIIISCKSKKRKTKCPYCEETSKSVHSYYPRKIRDLPLSGYSVLLSLKARKFYCKNPECSQKIFTERIEQIPAYTRMTKRSKEILRSLSVEVSANKAAYISTLINLPVSSSTILREVHSIPIQTDISIHTLGVDDWAMRKGVNYGTILVDMESNAVIDLLDGRDGVSLKSFLQDHPEIKQVCRDRSSSYSSAVSEVLPETRQIADRFHLVKNLSDVVYEIVKSESQTMRKLQKEKNLSVKVKSKTTYFPEKNKENKNNALKSTDRYQDLFYQVKNLRKNGYGYKTIATQLGISRNTVKKYDSLKYPIERTPSYQNNYLLFTSKIDQMLKFDYNIIEIFKEIKQKGYNGSYTSLCDYLKNNSNKLPIPAPKEKKSAMHLLSARKISMYLGMKKFTHIRVEQEREAIRTLLKKSSLLRKLRKAYISFKELLKDGSSKELKSWIEMATKIKRKPLMRLVNGIKRDIEAVTNAITTDWSSGKVEGKINKLKTIKRQMYGKASIELLKRKIILSNTG